MIVKSDNLVTAGAALSHMDLALWLVRRVSPQLASVTAKYLIVDSRPTQSAYALTDHLHHLRQCRAELRKLGAREPNTFISLDDAAKAVGASKRTIARRMHMVLGRSPISYFQSD